MQEEELQNLVRKYLNDTATAQEREHLTDWYIKQHTEETEWMAEAAGEEELLKADMLAYIQKQIRSKRNGSVRKLWVRIAAAASILLFLSIGGYFLLHKHPVQQVAQNPVQNIAPGSNKATLTLSDGKKINLSDAHNGTIASQGQTLIDKTGDGQLVYNAASATSPLGSTGDKTVYNTMTTPRGGQHWVTLSDGSKVLLNAVSSLRYPTTFTGDERNVELTGEAYFEVAHNKNRPFHVITKGQTVEVLGTHFNINAYDDEPLIKTTLLEGSVKVSENGETVLLKPGQQSIIALNHKIQLIKDGDIEEAVAWKNGGFQFNNTDVEVIMRQISRWYDADIEYKGDFKDQQYSGTVSRYANVADALKIMQSTGAIHFKIEGRRILVMP